MTFPSYQVVLSAEYCSLIVNVLAVPWSEYIVPVTIIGEYTPICLPFGGGVTVPINVGIITDWLSTIPVTVPVVNIEVYILNNPVAGTLLAVTEFALILPVATTSPFIVRVVPLKEILLMHSRMQKIHLKS